MFGKFSDVHVDKLRHAMRIGLLEGIWPQLVGDALIADRPQKPLDWGHSNQGEATVELSREWTAMNRREEHVLRMGEYVDHDATGL